MHRKGFFEKACVVERYCSKSALSYSESSHAKGKVEFNGPSLALPDHGHAARSSQSVAGPGKKPGTVHPLRGRLCRRQPRRLGLQSSPVVQRGSSGRRRRCGSRRGEPAQKRLRNLSCISQGCSRLVRALSRGKFLFVACCIFGNRLPMHRIHPGYVCIGTDPNLRRLQAFLPYTFI